MKIRNCVRTIAPLLIYERYLLGKYLEKIRPNVYLIWQSWAEVVFKLIDVYIKDQAIYIDSFQLSECLSY